MSEFTGRTLAEAIELGLRALGLSEEQAEIEIVDEGRGGVFGLGAKPAAVRITPKLAAPAPAPAPEPDPEPESALAAPPTPAVVEEEPASEDAEVLRIALQFLQGLVEHMGLEATVEGEVLPPEEGGEVTYYLNIAGPDLSMLIGRRGETLADIQYLTRLATNHQTHDWRRIEVDVEHYKRRREVSLQRLAEAMAERAVREARTIVLESMSARERRLIHMALRDRSDVRTQSVGEGEHRKVTIIPNTEKP
ncbi:MAG: protein jag [Caldilineales bacterium]|nr:protein jag [Caldilineales bacterium]